MILSVFPINPNTTFEDKQRALDGIETSAHGVPALYALTRRRQPRRELFRNRNTDFETNVMNQSEKFF